VLHKKLDVRDNARNSALYLAAKKDCIDVMKTLLNACPELATSHNTLLQTVIQEKRIQSFQELITYREDLINSDTMNVAILCESHNIVKELLSRARKKEKMIRLVDDSVAACVIKSSDTEMWEIVKHDCHDLLQLQTCDLLHVAVKFRRTEIVKHIAENFPTLSMEMALDIDSTDGPKARRYPLWYNSRRNGCSDSREDDINAKVRMRLGREPHGRQEILDWQKQKLAEVSKDISKTCEEIREILVPVIIRYTNTHEIQEILRQSEGEWRE
jgi:hypothetical protein